MAGFERQLRYQGTGNAPVVSIGVCHVCQKYYKLCTLAEMFDISEKTLRRMVTERLIKAKRIRGCVRIPHTEVVKMVEDY